MGTTMVLLAGEIWKLDIGSYSRCLASQKGVPRISRRKCRPGRKADP